MLPIERPSSAKGWSHRLRSGNAPSAAPNPNAALPLDSATPVTRHEQEHAKVPQTQPRPGWRRILGLVPSATLDIPESSSSAERRAQQLPLHTESPSSLPHEVSERDRTKSAAIEQEHNEVDAESNQSTNGFPEVLSPHQLSASAFEPGSKSLDTEVIAFANALQSEQQSNRPDDFHYGGSADDLMTILTASLVKRGIITEQSLSVKSRAKQLLHTASQNNESEAAAEGHNEHTPTAFDEGQALGGNHDLDIDTPPPSLVAEFRQNFPNWGQARNAAPNPINDATNSNASGVTSEERNENTPAAFVEGQTLGGDHDLDIDTPPPSLVAEFRQNFPNWGQARNAAPNPIDDATDSNASGVTSEGRNENTPAAFVEGQALGGDHDLDIDTPPPSLVAEFRQNFPNWGQARNAAPNPIDDATDSNASGVTSAGRNENTPATFVEGHALDGNHDLDIDTPPPSLVAEFRQNFPNWGQARNAAPNPIDDANEEQQAVAHNNQQIILNLPKSANQELLPNFQLAEGVALPPMTGHGIGPSSIPETLNNDRQLIPYSEARAKFYGPSRREAPLGADHGLLNNVNNSYDDVFQDAHSYFDDIDNAITDNLAQFTLGTRGERAAWDQTIEQAPPTAQATYFNNIAADADPVIAEELPREFHDDNWITSLHSQHEKDLEPAEASEWHDAQDTMPWDISQFATLTVPWQVPWDFSRLAGHDEAIQPLPIPEHDEQINQLAEAFGSFQPVEPHGSIPLQFLSNELNKPLSRQNSGQINGLARNDVQELHQELGNQQEPSNQINGSQRNHVRELHQELGNQQEPLDWYALAVALDKQYRDGLIQPNNR